MMEFVNFGGWPNCIRLSNGEIELVATTDVGPRIIRLGFVGGQNLFLAYPATLGRMGDSKWVSYGGHRLWHAPEAFPRTYTADNASVEHAWDGSTLTLRDVDHPNGLMKEVLLSLSPTAPCVEVVHRLVNRNPWTVELAVWAISVMAPGGRAICPQEDFLPHPEALTPARPLVLWRYTDMSDPRWTWGRRYIQVRQDPGATSKQKIGLLNRKGWAAYLVGGEAFIKHYLYEVGADYTDMGCNTEIFVDPNELEFETLGPLTRLEPGDHVDHVESWRLARVECGQSDTDIDSDLLPLVDAS